MPAAVQHLLEVGAGALHAALQAIQAPGVLDRAGAAAIALFVLACWLFAPRSSRPS